MFNKRLVQCSHILTCRTIHKQDVHLYNLVSQQLVVACRSLLKLFAIGCKVDAVAIEYGLLRRRYAHNVQLKSFGTLKFLVLIVYLLKKLSAHSSYTADKEV